MTPKPVYLIHAKTALAVQVLKEEGAVQFSSDTFLWDKDPASIHRLLAGEEWLPRDVSTLEIFVADKPSELLRNPTGKEDLKALLWELHQVAFWWSRKYANVE